MNKIRRADLLLTAGLLLLAGLLYLLTRPGGAGALAVVTVDGQEIARYPLAQETTVTIGAENYNVLFISGGTAAVIEANCGDHTCVNTGAVSREGEAIVCLPHRLVVRIEGGEASAFDAAAG